MIQRDCGKEKKAPFQTARVSLSPAETRLSQSEQGWARPHKQEDTQYGYLKLFEKDSAINQDTQEEKDFTQGAG